MKDRNRHFFWGALLAGLFCSSLLFVAAFTHDSYANSLEAALQSGLTRIKIDYENRLAGLKTTSLLFVGDIMLSRNVGRQMEGSGDYRYPFLNSADVLRSADLTFGNLEGPISSRGANQGSQYSFRADPRVIEGLEFAGFDGLSLANNHIWDWGRDALSDTLTLLQEKSIGTVGAGKDYDEANAPLIKTVNNCSVALLAYTDLYPSSLEAKAQSPGISDFNTQKVQTLISELNKQADVVVVVLHWGEEYAAEPSFSQREVARSFVDVGADIVIGHHPHVVQEVEAYKDGWIAHSLGNFVFDQNFSAETMEGLAIRAIIKDKNIVSLEQLPVSISDSFQPTIGQL